MPLDPIERLIAELTRLPGIGARSGARLAYYIIRASQKHSGQYLARDLARALDAVVDTVGFCQKCQNFCATQMCSICTNPRRDQQTVCVVEGVADLQAIEQTGSYQGCYHVLHGALAPLDGIGPSELKCHELMLRLQTDAVRELILATNTNVEGDATALYIASLVAPLNLNTTRLASGIPQGGELEYLDHATLGRALEERRKF